MLGLTIVLAGQAIPILAALRCPDDDRQKRAHHSEDDD